MNHNIDWFALLKTYIQESKNQKFIFDSTLNLDLLLATSIIIKMPHYTPILSIYQKSA